MCAGVKPLHAPRTNTIDMRLMAWTAAGYYRVFRGVTDDLDSKTRENLIRDYLPKRAQGARLVPRFRKEPFIDGICVWDNGNYSKGGELIKCYMRSVRPRCGPLVLDLAARDAPSQSNSVRLRNGSGSQMCRQKG
jgi:hypothetical protein